MSDRPLQTRAESSSSKHSIPMRPTPPPSALTPENHEQAFEPCAATGSFLLYSQRNVILVLHHDTLAIERRFETHREDIKWIAVDNVSEQGAGRVAVSYDAGHSTVVWDILTGREIARFVAYDAINVAQFMRNGNIAFGNVQGSIILFEPSTDENICARTIFDPVTAIAPASDNRTFAIGYLNGSILIATLKPAFTILHTLTTSRAPSKITGIAWHGSSSKQKTDMLATQTADGDLRVWSVPKAPQSEPPTIIRALSRSDVRQPGPSWFAWSKNGRLVQYYDNETRSWDVRTKRVTYDIVPTIDGVVALANYGPTATLFTLGRNHTVQQYDVSPTSVPLQVQSVQHAPANTPPTPPTSLEEQNNPYAGTQLPESNSAHVLPGPSDAESSADESTGMSPLQKIAREMDSLDQLESELRDKITPLSPTSSRASSTSSRSAGGGHRHCKYLYDRPSSSCASDVTGYEGTEFSLGGPLTNPIRDSMSIRSGSTRASHNRFRSSSLRREILRSPEEATAQGGLMDLFPFLKARLLDVPLQTPHYGDSARTAEMLQREMLSVVFGWNDTVENLVRDEMAQHRPGSGSAVLLAKWLGDVGADSMSSLVGSQSMTSSDWMLLALSSIGHDSQKRVGEAFVQRLLEKGDIHPAAAILLGLGEINDAVEVYVSQNHYMEAVLLSSLCLSTDWGRQVYLLRKWGEIAVKSGEPELAVRIFSCASAETTVPWTSPKTQDAVFAAKQQHEEAMDSARNDSIHSPPLSPPSRTASGRMKAKNASLKLITTFGEKGAPMKSGGDDPTPLAIGVTPILTSAMSPADWRSHDAGIRAPSSARTATPGGYTRRKRIPSRSDIARIKQEAAEIGTPISGPRNLPFSHSSASGSQGRRTPSVSDADEPATALRATMRDLTDASLADKTSERLPSPSRGSLARLRAASRPGNHSRDKSVDGMRIQILETRNIGANAISGSNGGHSVNGNHVAPLTGGSRGAPTPPLTGISLQSSKAKAIDDYIDSVEEARLNKRQARTASRVRGEHRSRSRADHNNDRAASRVRDPSEARGRAGVRYIAPAKTSPSSPIPMSPEEIAEANARQAEAANNEAENFYKLTSPIESHGNGFPTAEHRRHQSQPEILHIENAIGYQPPSPGRETPQFNEVRGRNKGRGQGSSARSPSSPLPMLADAASASDKHETQSDGIRVRSRARSSAGRDASTRRAASTTRAGERSRSARPKLSIPEAHHDASLPTSKETSAAASHPRVEHLSRPLTRKEIAARELEERRLSLARRPSAPAIPLPSDLLSIRPGIGSRSHTDLDNSPRSMTPPFFRSATADPEIASRYGRITITPTSSAQIGLPATPRAMKHPYYMRSDTHDQDAPPVPALPGSVSLNGGSLLSQTTGSSISQLAPSSLSQAGPSSPSQVSSSLVSDQSRDVEDDTVGQLLPSTVFGRPTTHGGPRAASAPLEGDPTHQKQAGSKSHVPKHSRRQSTGRGQVRMISPPASPLEELNPSHISSIDHAIHSNGDHHVIVLDQGTEDDPVLLPELQHLAMPPPPPPAPSYYQYLQSSRSEVGFAGIEGNTSTTATATSGTASDLSQGPTSFPQFPYQMERASTASPTSHRRGHGSISESFGSRMRGVADRMRNHSKSRAKSPPMLEATTYVPPYETALPTNSVGHQRKKSISRAKSPYEQAMAEQQNSMPPPPPPAPGAPPQGEQVKFNETSVPPRSQSTRDMGYRHPKEVRANMPPEQLQSGALGAGSTGFL
ncbi:hypothetical protein WHR41_08160 [Cladosporium halotolerans]|uniref:Gem-associated protein 5 TPR domain-containing protein n=1 Tax=Cladosporium halotolerans TaxID=1052096 RepID=A0AB34KH82_9PEZI